MSKSKQKSTTQSIKSLHSSKSAKSTFSSEDDTLPLDFDGLVSKCCEKYHCPRKVVVKKDYQLDDFLTAMKRPQTTPKTRRMSTAPALLEASEVENKKEDSVTATSPYINTEDGDSTVITAMYDNVNKFFEILLYRQKVIPRKLMQIIGVVSPNFRQLAKISIKKCIIDSYTIYELGKFIPLTSITEICLDESPVPESNYCILLQNPCRITRLSLSRCNISDEACIQIASSLHYQESAEETLAALDLSCNHITNVGAKSIGEALRTNRHLRYLNLADNRIDDDGADHIFHALIEFTLTCDETMQKRQRYFEHLKKKQIIYDSMLADWASKSKSSIDGFGIHKKQAAKKGFKQYKNDKHRFSLDDLHLKAEMVANKFVGPFIDPFSTYPIKSIDDYRCVGNFILCYLNLSYNYLSYYSIKKLWSVVEYQRTNKKLAQSALLKVVIDGNLTPSGCDELDCIGDLLQKNVIQFSPRYGGLGRDRRKSRTGTRISILRCDQMFGQFYSHNLASSK